MMEALHENCNEKMSTEDNSSLKDEFKSLMERVEISMEKS